MLFSHVFSHKEFSHSVIVPKLAIFAVQMLFFWCGEQKKFERAVQTFARVLPPYGPVLKKQSAVQKSVAFSSGGGVCVCRSLS